MIFRRSGSSNPLGKLRPVYPPQGAGPILRPAQGDHVFGDIIGIMRTGLMAVIGGGENWQLRFASAVYNDEGVVHILQTHYLKESLRFWNEIQNLDLGHGDPAPLMSRSLDIGEPDNHSLMFGGYSSVFQWDLCEIGHRKDGTSKFGNLNSADGIRWVKQVLFSYRQMMEFICDSTALNAYLASTETLRTTNAENLAPHTAISLDNVKRTVAQANTGPDRNQRRERIQQIERIHTNFNMAGHSLKRMLESMSRLKLYWNELDDRWAVF